MKPAKKIHINIKRTLLPEKHVVLSAVKQMVDFVKPTLGPKVRHILVNSGYKTELEDDGVSIMREFELEDPFENAVIEYVKNTSQKTDDKAGDGTTTTAVLTEALLREMIMSGKSYPEMVKELSKAKLEAIEQLQAQSREVKTEDDMFKVARTAMDDEEIAKLISSIIFEAGKDASVSITDYPGRGVECERLEGFVLPRGVIHRGMINDKVRQKAVMPSTFPDKPIVYVTDKVLSTVEDIMPILEEAQKISKNLFLVCSNLIGEAMLSAAQINMRGALHIVAIQLPGQGEKVRDYIDDICVVTGAKLGDEVSEESFGNAERIEVSFDDTSIIGGGGDKESIKQRIDFLKQRADELKEDYDKAYFFQRQARLQGGIRVIKVGGLTDAEIGLRLKKIEDSVNSCKCAFEGGIIPGGGAALARITTSSEILNKAIRTPRSVIYENSESKPVELAEGQAHNMVSGEVGDFLSVGVADSLKVVKTALENAISTSVILFNISGISTNEPSED